jgi:hypothetical protein
MKPKHSIFLFLVLLLAGQTTHADGTMRLKATFKLGALIPASAIHQAPGQMKMGDPIFSVIEVKGDQEYSDSGFHSVIYDFKTQQITILDPGSKHYATVYMTDYLAALGNSMPTPPNIPPAAKFILQTIKANFATQDMGKTDVVQGIPVAEKEWTLTVTMPAGALPLPGIAASAPNGTLTLAKIVADVWIASPAEVQRHPALKELMSHSSAMTALFNPDNLLKVIGDYPGVHDTLASMLTSYENKPPAVLKMDAQIYLPVLAQLAPVLAAQGHPLPANVDPNASLADIDVQADEISDAPISASVFQVPADYTSVPLSEILKPATPAPKTSASVAAPGVKTE